MKWHKALFSNPVTAVGIVLAVLAAITGVIGYVQLHGTFDFVTFLNDFYANLSAELGSIAITVIVIDQLNRRRDDRRRVEDLKAQLLRQVRSPEHTIVNHALHEIREHGWLTGEHGLLNGKKLPIAKLQKAHLMDANLQEADLFYAKLQGANLLNANLQSAHLLGVNLQEADLKGANLREADLRRANLQEADLMGANLQGANLLNANLQSAHLLGVNLQGANLMDANLRGAHLMGANLQGANLSGTKFDHKSVLPDARQNIAQGQLTPDSYWTPETDMRRYTDSDIPISGSRTG